MSIDKWKDVAATIQSFATALSIFIGGLWVYRKYIRQVENYPNIEFSAELNFIGKQSDWWIVELVALVENKGKVQHRMSELRFDLNAIYEGEAVEVSQQWGGQVDFNHAVTQGSFLPQRFKFFFVDPGVKAKYSYVARIPKQANFAILHCWFNYSDPRKLGHTAEKTVRIPVQ